MMNLTSDRGFGLQGVEIVISIHRARFCKSSALGGAFAGTKLKRLYVSFLTASF